MSLQESETTSKDPICGMTVDKTTSLHTERDGKTFYFCSDDCMQTFLSKSSTSKEKNDSGCCGS